jgi:predicted amidohydrolase YtcJ
VTRVPFDEPDIQPFLPHERLDLGTAIDAFTQGSAFVNHLDDVTGTLQPGKLADIAVLSKNILAVPEEEIASARVDLTILGGTVRFTR